MFIALIALAIAQQTPPQLPKFFIQTLGDIKPFDVVPISAGKITFTWNSDTCAGFLNASGNIELDSRLDVEQNTCVDKNGNPLGPPDATTVFPQGFSKVSFQKLFDVPEANPINLLDRIQNSGTLVGQTKSLDVDIRNLRSGYYSLILEATDVNRQFVQGRSAVVAIKGTGDIPAVNNLVLHSPLKGSFWLANSVYRIRFEILPTGVVPDLYHVDLLTPNGEIVARVVEGGKPLADDFLMGQGHPLNYTLWQIPKELSNRRFKLRVTGIQVDGDKFITLANPAQQESGIFFIGPVKPE